MQQKFLERINILQVVLFVAIFGILTGLLPLADGVNANETITKLSAILGVTTVVSPIATRKVVDALAEVQFKSDAVNQAFDALKLFMGSSGGTQMQVTTTAGGVSATVVPELKPDSKIEAAG